MATLRDNIYIHKKKLYNEPCWKVITNGSIDKYIIFPYDNNNTNKTYKIIDENIFSRDNPQTYKYLCDNKQELAKRDKGNKIYALWYAYGRTQSLQSSNPSNPSQQIKYIYIPTFINPENITYLIDDPKLFVSCLCIMPNDNKYIDIIINAIKQNIEYIKNNSSKRGGGWINLTSTVIKNIPI